MSNDIAGEGEREPFAEIDYRFVASVNGKTMECASREEARAWIAKEREVSGNYEGTSRIEQVGV